MKSIICIYQKTDVQELYNINQTMEKKPKQNTAQQNIIPQNKNLTDEKNDKLGIK